MTRACLALLLLATPVLADDPPDVAALIAAIDTAPHWSRIAPLAVEAQRLSEDKHFSDETDAASTITRLAVRQHLHADTAPRGLAEALVVRLIGTALPAERILDSYVDGLFLGPNCTGLDAGARGLFGKPPSDLTAAEAAVLAVLAKAPSMMKQPDRLVDRASFVLHLMQDAGLVPDAASKEIPVLPPTAGCPAP